MTGADLRDFLKIINNSLNNKFLNFYTGKIDSKKDKALCTYTRDAGRRRNVAVGGQTNTITQMANFDILIHWNENYNETEKAAKALYGALCDKREVFRTFNINYIDLIDETPMDLRNDDNGIYERLIRLTIYYNNI